VLDVQEVSLFLGRSFYSLQTEMLKKEFLLLFIWQMNHIKEVVLVLLNVLVQCAYNLAWRTGSNCI
jgi:hypothetical protein